MAARSKGRWPFAPGTTREIVAGAVLWTAGLGVAILFPGAVTLGLAVALGLGWLGLLFFLRDPERRPAGENGVILSPADGRVIEVARVREDIYLQQSALRVSIFLGVLDVHINRSPMGGQIESIDHANGQFLRAFLPEASELNESNWIVIADGGRRILLRQIAGILARRIECWVAPGDMVRAGERIGIIKLGSRVELYLPEDIIPLVERGARVRAGQTPLASFGPRQGNSSET